MAAYSLRAALAFFLVCGVLPAMTAGAAGHTAPVSTPQGGYHYYLVGIEVAGAKRLKRQDVIALSGLKTGTTVEPRDIQVAQARLLDSGLFAQVGSRLRTTGRGYSLIVTFTVEEPAWQAPVFFDNFVGVTDVQLQQAVAEVIPTFDGVVPESPRLLERVRGALERLARNAGEPGTVSWLLVQDKLLGLRRYRFHLDRASGPLNICSISIATNADDARDRMASAANALVGGDYSKDYVSRHALQNVLPVATALGYLQARLGSVDAARQPTSTGACAGVAVTIGIQAGAPYAWQAVSWVGNTTLASTDLERLFPITPGDRADATKVDRAISAISEAYHNRGYVRVTVRAEPKFDDASRQVSYVVRIAEGPQFRMGTLTVVGLDPAVADAVKALWTLAQGEVFDLSYSSRFVADARARVRGLTPSRSLEIVSKPDVQRNVVDVTVTAVPRS